MDKRHLYCKYIKLIEMQKNILIFFEKNIYLLGENVRKMFFVLSGC